MVCGGMDLTFDMKNPYRFFPLPLLRVRLRRLLHLLLLLNVFAFIIPTKYLLKFCLYLPILFDTASIIERARQRQRDRVCVCAL